MNIAQQNCNEDLPITPDWRVLVDRFYGTNALARNILIEHSRAVGTFAQEINIARRLGLRPDEIMYGAMVHDIGIFLTEAPGIGCEGNRPYICHGILGADLLRMSGAPEWAARIAERHTGTGLTATDIATQNLPLPTDRILTPQTTLERLICYADKFYSKRPGQLSIRKSLDRVRNEMKKHGTASLERFETMHHEFGAE